MDNKQAHLNMIQNVINRLSRNSFLLKGWSVVLVSAVFSLARYDGQIMFVLIAYFPALVFWGLDGYFLREEKLFRELYDEIRKAEEGSISFSMDRDRFDDQVDPWWRVTLSKTLGPFHGVVTATITIVFIVGIYVI